MVTMCLKGRSNGPLNYPGAMRIEKYQSSFFSDWNESYVEVPWLNLLYYLSLSEALQDLPVTVGYYIVLRSIYDKEIEVFEEVKEQLKELFQNSFLFQEPLKSLQYCKNYSHILTLERLKIVNQQMTVLDSLDYFEEDMTLEESMRVIWRETQMPKQGMTLEAFDYESSLLPEKYQKLTWFIPFNTYYPVDEIYPLSRYMTIV